MYGCATFIGLFMLGFAAMFGAFFTATSTEIHSAEETRSVLAHGSTTVSATVRSASQDRNEDGVTYQTHVTYDFPTPDGRRFGGVAIIPKSSVAVPSPITVEYATCDPVVNRPAGRAPQEQGAVLARAVMLGMAGVSLIAVFSFGVRRYPGTLVWRAVVCVSMGLAAWVGSVTIGPAFSSPFTERYAIQVGDTAMLVTKGFSSRAFGKVVSLDRGHLTVGDRDFGAVPDHAHILITPTEVKITPQ